MTHSPRPWKVEINSDDDLNVVTDEGHFIYIGNLEGTCDVCHANARLIAASPDLLGALKELVNLVEDGDYVPDIFTLQPARQAIAKAESSE